MNGDPAQRFGGVARLCGPEGFERLAAAHVCVVGLGGVGSWAVEALARTGVGTLTLVDLDDVCITNVNRQIQALDTTIGLPKAEALAARIRLINPQARLHPRPVFFNEDTAADILATPYACLVDAIDNTSNKCRLIAGCRERGIPVVTSGGAGGRLDPGRVRVDDLAFTTHDRLLAQVRSLLRQDFGFPRGPKPFGVPCVHSTEPLSTRRPDGPPCPVPPQTGAAPSPRANCDSGLGTVSFVTGVFGFQLAGLAVRAILGSAPRG